ncbi:MAG: S-adenosylmethionine:tRNA ribosyltransferase-isomerase [Tannerella sp.]|jgi:S-adenosylmethionine:tRNA ribosyltransferase-isomerase|nr:S-adenosylmethionine:tRNA ribosyltransferase-isomerase [Tannerella sp.]
MTAQRPADIRIADYDYDLPPAQIARYPLPQRDASRLLVYRDGAIGETRFGQLADHLPDRAMLVFNNTRVIRARLPFRKETGAHVEIFCLEPAEPADYALVFSRTRQCSWHCLIGNLKKWKSGPLQLTVPCGRDAIRLVAERKTSDGDRHLVTFTWDHPGCTFADILEAAGILPIPPYLHRETEQSDLQTYQTVYAQIKGSVAAPTAGLHFTPETLDALHEKGFIREEVTLHVGAGTFRPVRTATVGAHDMHAEHISVSRRTIDRLLHHREPVIAVGTTSVRTLESLYHIGALLAANPRAADRRQLCVEQWMPYDSHLPSLPLHDALQHILDHLDRRQTDRLLAQTQLLIAPGYTFRTVHGIITNFHQPQSTLLLLVSAFVRHGDWRRIYNYALERRFRFLSYGDGSLLLRK